MPYRKEQFVNGEIYHVVLRGIDDNAIFKDIDDYYRGIFSIYEFNNTEPVEILKRREQRRKEKLLEVRGGPTSPEIYDRRKKIVEVLCFSFMPNHFHLLLKQIRNQGINKFMVKIGTGYGGYFNRKYNRKGYVFQNRFFSVRIKNDNQLKTIFTYIHTNPISLIEPNWKERGIKNPKKVIEFLENYKWSSYPDYLGRNNFPSVTDRNFILEIMGGSTSCKDFIKNWVKYKQEPKDFPELFLE